MRDRQRSTRGSDLFDCAVVDSRIGGWKTELPWGMSGAQREQFRTASATVQKFEPRVVIDFN